MFGLFDSLFPSIHNRSMFRFHDSEPVLPSPEEGEVLIFCAGYTPAVGDIIQCKDNTSYEIVRSIGGPNFMAYGKPL